MGSRAVRLFIVALIAVGVLIPTMLVLTQERASAASMVLSILDGTADVARGPAVFARAGDGQVLLAGDRVRTAEQSHAVVTFFDGSTIEIEPATTITVVQANPESSWRYYIAALPSIPAAVGLFIFVRGLMRLDEIQVKIQLFALGLAVGATALATFGYGFFESAGLPHMSPAYVLPLLALFWGLGTAFFTWRYRRPKRR